MKKTRDQWIRERTEAEVARGATKVAERILAKEFDPDYVPDATGYMPSAQERAHREEYRRINRHLRGDPDA